MSLRGRIVRHIPNDIRLRKRAWQAWLRVGEPELRLLPILCRSDAGAIDVGANSGIYAYHLQRYAHRTIAIEANPKHTDFIRSALPGISVIAAAASDRIGMAMLRIPRDADGMATLAPENELEHADYTSLEVPLVTIDSLDLPRTGFIKIDVEGHELAVLRGSMATIERDRPCIIVESEERHRPGAVATTANILTAHGYSGFFLYQNRILPIEQFDRRVHQNLDCLPRRYRLAGMNDDPAASARNVRNPEYYVNNFVFVHRAEKATIADLLACRGA